MNYKDIFYSKYVSTHTKKMGMEPSVQKEQRDYVFWEKYFRGLLPIDKKARILDIGCGTGSFILWLEKMGYENLEGVDVSREQIDIGNASGVRNLACADAKDFLGKNIHAYDLIVARDFLEHFTKGELLDLMDLIKKSMKEHGCIIVQTINAENVLWGRLRYGDFTHD
ncbi:class I SAM-dependent methyltransferase [bacterium]|nr:MAG: class I SAM-dependent methyltransferase [bacterium]